MAKVMLRENDKGQILFYLAKRDMEEIIETLEFDSDEKWGGNVNLTNGDIWYITPQAKTLPDEVVAKIVQRGDND
ncbi:MAG: nitrogen fixation protein NifT [Sulfurimonas sp.]|jgi:nitrogen fixation protein NifT|uniref:putative nitrogen fixation protein NifT n=1 Tax=Sulfurimonas sp. TaxID=2022749 RepID=UPI0039E673F5